MYYTEDVTVFNINQQTVGSHYAAYTEFKQKNIQRTLYSSCFNQQFTRQFLQALCAIRSNCVKDAWYVTGSIQQLSRSNPRRAIIFKLADEFVEQTNLLNIQITLLV